MKKTRSLALGGLSLAVLLSGCILVSSGCVYVRVRGNFSESQWLDELIDDVHGRPDSFERGETNFEFSGFLWDAEGRLEMDFACHPEDVDAYLAGVGGSVEREIAERECHVTSVVEEGRTRTYLYAGSGRSGEVELEIHDQPTNETYPYRLVLRWDEDE